MSSPHMQLALWLIQPPIQVAITIALYRRRLNREFPAFFYYVIAQIAIFCVQVPVYRYGPAVAYFDVYWASEAISLFLAARVIHEIFLDVFKPYHALKDLGTALFKWAAIIMVLVSVILISLSPSLQSPLVSAILVVQRCVSVVLCGLVIFLLAFSRYLGVHWRRLSFGIALGFGILSAGDLLSTALYSGHRVQVPMMQMAVMCAYNAGMLIWLIYSVANRRSDLVPVLVPQRWDEALMEIQPHENEGDSLIPMFEHMVDQALAKTNTHP